MSIAITVPALHTAQASKLRRILVILQRALSMDPSALVRVRQLTGGVDLFISTPLGCVITQRLEGAQLVEAEQDGAVVSGYQVHAALDQLLGKNGASTPPDSANSTTPKAGLATPEAPQRHHTADFGARQDLLWPGSLPPVDGFALVDWVPGAVLRELYTSMGKENEANAGPGGVARSLLEQTLLTVSADASREGNDTDSKPGNPEDPIASATSPTPEVAIDGRAVAALGGLGVVAEPKSPQLARWDKLRISTNGAWNRIDALFGTLYAPRPGSLVRVPGH